MFTLRWNEVGKNYFGYGLDRGVLYLPTGEGFAWNGLISFQENFDDTVESVYFDGISVGAYQNFGNFAATMSAYTYPEEFLQFEGIQEIGEGLFVDDQPLLPFHLSYRTRIGNDLDQDEHYQIHVVYNLTAIPQDVTYTTLSRQSSATPFSWSISSIPEKISNHRPTAHLILDSRTIQPYLLETLEEKLYGALGSSPLLPSLEELINYILDWKLIVITDHGDGTWSATGPADLVYLTDPTTFRIDQVNATYRNADMYDVSTTA